MGITLMSFRHFVPYLCIALLKMDANENMIRILEKVGLNSGQISVFIEQKISPDIVSYLSLHEFQCLGVTDKSEIMKLRMECVTYKRSNAIGPQRRCDVSKKQIVDLLGSGFSIADTSHALLISQSTIYRKMRQFNISKHVFAEISDNELDGVVSKMLEEFPHCGEKMLLKVLHGKGIKVQRLRLRSSLKRLDSHGISERKKGRLKRRVYNVQGPNHLWHIDTNHKLIRWHFVICGGIDGFSRLITFLACTGNNKASTVYHCFMQGIQKYGTPVRARSDMGMENIKVAEYMNSVRGPNSMLIGKSTHNQRIERLWRDVFNGVLSYFYDLFYFIEDEYLIDVLNEKHLYVLHNVYLRRINERLDLWLYAWNNHRIRTVKSTPLRLFTAGMLTNAPANPDHDQIIDTGSDERDPEDRYDQRPISEFSNLHLSRDCLAILEEECPQNWISNNHGIDVLVKARQIIDRF